MGIASRLRTRITDITSIARMAPHLHEFNPRFGRHNVARYVAERAEEQPNGMGIRFEQQSYTWRQVNAQVNRYARFFRSIGVAKGDVVALFMDNRPEYLFVVTALSRLGGIAALINTNNTQHALVHSITISEARAVVCGEEHFEALDEVVADLPIGKAAIYISSETGNEPAPGYESLDRALEGQVEDDLPGIETPSATDVMCYIYTSGTTGLPKAAIITNRRWVVGAYMFGRAMMEATPRDALYCVLPLYHSNGMIGCWGTCATTGATIALRRKFSASQFWDDVRKFDASLFVYIGELCRYLLNTEPSRSDRTHRMRVRAALFSGVALLGFAIAPLGTSVE